MLTIIPQIVQTNNLILHTAFAIFLAIVFPFLKIPALFLHGVHTYIHPDDVNPSSTASSGGIRAAIRRPGAIDSEQPKRKKSKEKFEFDESKAQIFRLKLNSDHLQSRIYFREFYSAFNFTLIALSSLLLHRFVTVEKNAGILKSGTIIPLLLGLVSLFRMFFLIIKAGFERSASKKLEKQLSFVFGILGFLLGLALVFGVIPNWLLDFSFKSLDGLCKFCIAVFMGCVVGYLYIPALRNARCFWLGTDQIRCNLSIISCGWLSRMIVYANFIVPVFTSLLWITPFSALLINDGDRNKKGEVLELAGYVGFVRSDFEYYRHWCLIITTLLQLLAVRCNAQMFLNEAVLCWYQRLHASKVPNLEYSRAKVFLHNHYLCLVVSQFMAPPAVVLILVALSQLERCFVTVLPVFPYWVLAKDVVLFVCWWIVFVWAVFSSAIVALYRHGTLYVS